MARAIIADTKRFLRSRKDFDERETRRILSRRAIFCIFDFRLDKIESQHPYGDSYAVLKSKGRSSG